MKCKDLFKNSEVVFVPLEDDLQKQENTITQYAFYHGIKVKVETGLWLNPATAECEKVLKITYLGENEKKEKRTISEFESQKIKMRMKKIERIKEYLRQGMSVPSIAKLEGCTKQNMYQFIKTYNIKVRGG